MTDKNPNKFTEEQIRIFNMLPFEARKEWLEQNPPGAPVSLDFYAIPVTGKLGDLLNSLMDTLGDVAKAAREKEEDEADAAYEALVENMPDMLMEGNLRQIFHAGFHMGRGSV